MTTIGLVRFEELHLPARWGTLHQSRRYQGATATIAAGSSSHRALADFLAQRNAAHRFKVATKAACVLLAHLAAIGAGIWIGIQ